MQQKFMDEALKEARKAYKKDEVPIGAIIVKDNEIISKAHNLVETKKDATMHAEIIAIKKASKKIGNWRLNDCEMYVTLEPCLMCQKAIELSRIKTVYFSTYRKNDDNKLTSYEKYDYYETHTTKIIQDFFNNKRR